MQQKSIRSPALATLKFIRERSTPPNMDSEQLRELAERLDALTNMQMTVMEALDMAQQVENLCNELNIMTPHHATMELDECLAEVGEAIELIESM